MRIISRLMLALLLGSLIGTHVEALCLDGQCTPDGQVGFCDQASSCESGPCEAGPCEADPCEADPCDEWTSALTAASCTVETAGRLDQAGFHDDCCRSVDPEQTVLVPLDVQVQQAAALAAWTIRLPTGAPVLRQRSLITSPGRDPPWPQLKATVELLI